MGFFINLDCASDKIKQIAKENNILKGKVELLTMYPSKYFHPDTILIKIRANKKIINVAAKDLLI
jgi:hypothetical protein